MALHRFGDSGAPVRDIQDRLSALGYDTSPDAAGAFGVGTRKAVEEFQHARNLAVDGMVGRETWRNLVAAGNRLGDRILYYRIPMMRGDDVAHLQRTLNSLGFDAGVVDGIFGPDTQAALLDFQQNRRLAEDGMAGERAISELRLVSKVTEKTGRQTVRERVWLRSLGATVAGMRIAVDAFCRDELEGARAWEAASAAADMLREHGAHPLLTRSSDTTPPEQLRARHANDMGADMVLGLSQTPDPAVLYFESPYSRSEAGLELATALATRLGLSTEGRATPLLRETRAPASVVAVSRLDAHVGRAVAAGVISWLRDLADQPPSPR